MSDARKNRPSLSTSVKASFGLISRNRRRSACAVSSEIRCPGTSNWLCTRGSLTPDGDIAASLLFLFLAGRGKRSLSVGLAGLRLRLGRGLLILFALLVFGGLVA